MPVAKQLVGICLWEMPSGALEDRNDGGKSALTHHCGLGRSQDIHFPIPMIQGSLLAAPAKSGTGWEVRPAAGNRGPQGVSWALVV